MKQLKINLLNVLDADSVVKIVQRWIRYGR